MFGPYQLSLLTCFQAPHVYSGGIRGLGRQAPAPQTLRPKALHGPRAQGMISTY